MKKHLSFFAFLAFLAVQLSAQPVTNCYPGQAWTIGLPVVNYQPPFVCHNCETNSTYWDPYQSGGHAYYGGWMQQGIHVTNNVTVCAVWLYMTTGTATVQFWSGPGGTGYQIGGTSEAAAGNNWPTVFTWTNNYPNLTGDCYLFMPQGYSYPVFGTDNAAHYWAGSNYVFSSSGGGATSYDLTFAILTCQ